MKRLAIFVEGGTEQVFVEKLIVEIATDKNIEIKLVRGTGRLNRRSYDSVRATSLNNGTDFYIIIYNSGGDTSVNADIKDQYRSLVRSGYDGIIGIKDVYPRQRSDAVLLMYYFAYMIPTVPIKPLYLLSIMEIEAWFIAEHTHFTKIDPALTCSLIKANTGFDPSTDDPQLLHHPAAELDTYYQLVGKYYDKNLANIGHPDNRFRETPNVLDYAQIYLDVINRIPPLKLLVEAIDSFLTTATN